MQSVLSLILGGGRGTRLYPLTRMRSKPAVPLAGKYRLIDIPISNCINSGCNRIYILTQFLSVSLHRHIANTYKFDPFSRGFVEVLAAQQTNETADWYQGTADAVRQQIRSVREDPSSEIMILSGDQLYRMDFGHLLATHRETQADVTIAVLPTTRQQVSGFGIVQLNDTGQVVGFIEKPQTDEQLQAVRTSPDWLEKRGIPCKGRHFLASMGIYLFKKEVLFELLTAPPLATDFGKEIFPRSIRTHNVQAHLFDGYWEDLGTIKAYHEANMALASDDPPFSFYSPEGVIFTRMRFLPPSHINAASLQTTLISDGCHIEQGSRIERSIIGIRSQIGRNTTITDCVIIGADRFETEAERVKNRARGIPSFTIGEGSVIQNAILDKDCRVGQNVRIINQRGVHQDEGTNYVIREGIVVIPRGSVIPDGTVI